MPNQPLRAESIRYLEEDGAIIARVIIGSGTDALVKDVYVTPGCAALALEDLARIVARRMPK